jgi:hypothetical protein
MKNRILVMLVAGFLPMSLWAAPYVVYQTGFEASGEPFGNFPLGGATTNGWVFNNNWVTNNFAAPGGGSQSVFMDGSFTANHTTTPYGGPPQTNISLVSFDWFSPKALNNNSIVQINGLGIEMIFRSSQVIQLIGTNGSYQSLNWSDVTWTSNVWYHVDLGIRSPGLSNLTTLTISTNGVQMFSGNKNPNNNIPFGRITAPDPANLAIYVHGSGGAGDGFGAYFDNLRIEAIPEPVALPLVGMAALLLGWMRRRGTR